MLGSKVMFYCREMRLYKWPFLKTDIKSMIYSLNYGFHTINIPTR